MSDDAAAFGRRFDVSRETTGRLEIYADLLRRWNPKINLVSKSTIANLWARHMLDSAQIFGLAPDSAQTWGDLGSGGGFPGAVVAIMAQELRPGMSVTLIESDQRKATFLRTVARETGTAFAVRAERIEATEPLAADVISARALAPLTDLLFFAKRHLALGGVAIFPKGANARNEIAAALETWRFDCETYPSETDEEAVILKIGDIERV